MKMRVTDVPTLAVALLLLVGAAQPLAAQRRAPRDRGGTSLLLEVRAEGARAGAAVERTAAVIRRRCARLGAYCRVEPRPGGASNRLALRFSSALDSERVKAILLAEGVEVRAAVSVPFPFPMASYPTRADADAAAGELAGTQVFPLAGYDGEPDTFVLTKGDPIVTGDDLRTPFVVRAPRDVPGRGYVVDSQLRPAGAARLKAWTSANIGQYITVVYNGRALEGLYVKSPVVYNVVVAGGFNRRQAEDVAAVLAGGNLPAPVEVLEEGTYTPRTLSPALPKARQSSVKP